MTPELLLGLAAGLLAAAGILVWILHRVLRKQCAALSERMAAEAMPDALRRLGELTEQLEAELARRCEELKELTARVEGKADAEAPDHPPTGGLPIESQTQAILRLDRAGLDPIEISRRSGSPVGEVELVLNLNRPRPAGQGAKEAS